MAYLDFSLTFFLGTPQVLGQVSAALGVVALLVTATFMIVIIAGRNDSVKYAINAIVTA